MNAGNTLDELRSLLPGLCWVEDTRLRHYFGVMGDKGQSESPFVVRVKADLNRAGYRSPLLGFDVMPLPLGGTTAERIAPVREMVEKVLATAAIAADAWADLQQGLDGALNDVRPDGTEATCDTPRAAEETQPTGRVTVNRDSEDFDLLWSSFEVAVREDARSAIVDYEGQRVSVFEAEEKGRGEKMKFTYSVVTP